MLASTQGHCTHDNRDNVLASTQGHDTHAILDMLASTQGRT